ncbi:VTT domain-containing protein [uncultured Limosilactobacillus sp.]|uniref:VTT domain-containing protein n=1 Tax=uncultured Limosilactobacillus sp. TaxID=2837629 RepID=UPI0025EA2370|nr:VTT domain-containing protein [uncultured Limosilactobacillus sp.]
MEQLIYGLTHLPEVIIPIFNATGAWGYLILFLITFMETGLVIFPWLPGESLIFVASSLAALNTNSIKISVLISGFFVAAFIGDIVNYTIGTHLIKWPWLRKKVMGPNWQLAHDFFEQHGIIAVIFGRFVPLIRTFVPLISGSAGFKFSHFIVANFCGTLLWVLIAALSGYYLGTIPFVKAHFSLLLLILIMILMLPALILTINRLIRRRLIKKNNLMK